MTADDRLNKYFSQYDFNWLDKFLNTVFGKYRYVHTLSERGLNVYISNKRSVTSYHPDDTGAISFTVKTGDRVQLASGALIETVVNGLCLYNMVDFKDPVDFIYTFNKYYKLKAFL